MVSTLGAQVHDVMRAAISVSADKPVAEAALVMIDQGTRSLVVVDESQHLLGILKARHLSGNGRKTVGQAMDREVPSVEPSQPLHVAARTMLDSQLDEIPVLADGAVVGILAWEDVRRSFDG